MLAVALLAEAGIAAHACPDLDALAEALGPNVTFLVLAEEAVRGADLGGVRSWIEAQPAWSDLPVIVLTQRGAGPQANPAARRLIEALGNVSFLERPFNPTTFASVARTALKARRRQFEARERLEELDESRERLATAMMAGRLGDWQFDVKTQTLQTSAMYREIHGRKPEADFSYADLMATIHPAELEAFEAAMRRSIETGEDINIEYRALWPDDGVHWVQLNGRVVQDERGQATSLVGVVKDISVRREAEGRLRETNEVLERRIEDALAGQKVLADIVESTDSFVQVVGHDLRFLAINRASADESERIYGVRPQVGDDVLEVMPGAPEEQAATRAMWKRALAGEQFTMVVEIKDPKLGPRHYETKFNRLLDREGRPLGAYMFGYDVTQRLADEERLRVAQDALRQSQKMEAVGQLTGGVAHDFNNLLTAVLSNLELLRKHVGEDARAARLIDGAVQGATRGAALTQRLLAFSRRQALKVAPADMTRLVDGMKELLERSVGPGVELVFDIAADLPPALVDPNQLELALLNLVVNARDAMPQGGSVTISVDTVTAGAAQGLAPGKYVRLSVTDTGTGMDEETLQRAIEPFFSTKEIGKGTGLGLSMIHGLAVQLHGALRLASTPGKGTRAELYLPATTEMAQAAPRREGEAPATNGRDMPRAKILLVDDDALIAMSTADMLQDLGHEVIEVNSGASALEALRRAGDVDLLITDFAMPGMNGAQLAEAVRELAPGLPILLATGYADMPNGAGKDLPRLGKPYSQAQLAREISKLLAAGGSANPGRGQQRPV